MSNPSNFNFDDYWAQFKTLHDIAFAQIQKDGLTVQLTGLHRRTFDLLGEAFEQLGLGDDRLRHPDFKRGITAAIALFCQALFGNLDRKDEDFDIFIREFEIELPYVQPTAPPFNKEKPFDDGRSFGAEVVAYLIGRHIDDLREIAVQSRTL